MFTGIVEEIGIVKEIVRGSRSLKLFITCTKILDGLKTGDSISVDGICLTVTEIMDNCFAADVMPETVRKTGLEKLSVSDRVNIERALRLSDRLGGHIVSGHIDGTGIITARKEEDNAVWLTVNTGTDILKYIVMKGSVALDGTSLTVAYADEASFKVSLIPFTAGVTTLGLRKAGDIVNIECDIIGKYIEKFVHNGRQDKNLKEDLTVEFLRERGFA